MARKWTSTKGHRGTGASTEDSTCATYGQAPENQDSLDDQTTAPEVAAAGLAAATHVAVQRITVGCSADHGESEEGKGGAASSWEKLERPKEEIAREVAVKGVANAADAAFRSLGLVEEVPSLGGAEEIAREVAIKGVANAADAAFRSLGLVEEVPSLGGAVPFLIKSDLADGSCKLLINVD